MALYLGSSKKLKVYLNGVIYCVNIPFNKPIENSIRLLSSDGFFLKDSNESYLTINHKGE